MKNILAGRFDQIENLISADFAKDAYIGVKNTTFLGLLPVILLFAGGPYALYGFGWYIFNHMNELSVPLDPKNEFKIFFTKNWHIHFLAFFFIVGILWAYSFKERNRIKSFYIGRLLSQIYMPLFCIVAFITAEVFVSSFTLRIIYVLLLILSIIYTAWKSLLNIRKLVFGEVEISGFQAWIDKNKVFILGVLFSFGSLFYLVKTIFSSIGDMETRIMGALADYFPLFLIIGAIFANLYYIKSVIRAYYLNKYSEEFRLKFGVEKKDWYGPHVKSAHINTNSQNAK